MEVKFAVIAFRYGIVLRISVLTVDIILARVIRSILFLYQKAVFWPEDTSCEVSWGREDLESLMLHWLLSGM